MRESFRIGLPLKITATFLFILVSLEVLILIVFQSVVTDNVNSAVMDYIDYRAGAFMGIVELEGLEQPHGTTWDKPPCNSVVKALSEIWKAKIWITTSDNRLLVQYFDGPVPVIPEEELVKHKSIFYLPREIDDSLYTRTEIKLPDNRKGYWHMASRKFSIALVDANLDGARLTFFLFVIGTFFGVAILVFPIISYITRPLEILHRSALKIADGDFSQRTHIRAKDEIGDLSRGFNQMAESLQAMIRGTKELYTHISHEMRTPLSRLLIALELHREKLKKRDAVKDYPQLDLIEKDIEYMDRLVGRLLQLSRLDAKLPSLPREETDLVKRVTDAVERFSSAIRKKHIEVVTRFPGETVLMNVVKKDIDTALSNLIDNAVKYTPKGGRIEIDLTGRQGQAVLAMANTCPLLMDKDLENMFKSFYRASDQEMPGTGLGLAITKKIVENMGGHIEASHWKDKGFMITTTLSFKSKQQTDLG